MPLEDTPLFTPAAPDLCLSRSCRRAWRKYRDGQVPPRRSQYRSGLSDPNCTTRPPTHHFSLHTSGKRARRGVCVCIACALVLLGRGVCANVCAVVCMMPAGSQAKGWRAAVKDQWVTHGPQNIQQLPSGIDCLCSRLHAALCFGLKKAERKELEKSNTAFTHSFKRKLSLRFMIQSHSRSHSFKQDRLDVQFQPTEKKYNRPKNQRWKQ